VLVTIQTETQYLDAAEVLLLALDLEGRVTFLNRYASALLEWRLDELSGRDFTDTCVPSRLRPKIRDLLRQVRGGNHAVVEWPVITRGGEERMIEWRPSFLRDAEGRVVGTLCSGTDITGRQRAEGMARLQAAALHAAANAIMITDRDGIIRWANPAFSALSGYSPAELEGRNPRELVKSDRHTHDFYEDMWRTILAGDVWRGETINRRKDGSLYTEQQAITPVRDGAGEITHFIAVKEDITPRLRAEAELRSRVQLSALAATVGESLAYTESLSDALQECAEAFVTHLDAAAAHIWTIEESGSPVELRATAGVADWPPDAGSAGDGITGRIVTQARSYETNSIADEPGLVDPLWIDRHGVTAFSGHPLVAGGRVIGVMAMFSRHALGDAARAAFRSLADHVALGIERHRGAERLRAADERMRFVLHAAGVGLWDMDFTSGRIQWSDILEVQHGILPGTFAGTFDAFIDRVHPDDRPSVIAAVRAQKAAGDFPHEYRTTWSDGTVRWLSGAGRMFTDQDGNAVRAVGVSLDVTERRTLEQQYQQAQKMEAVGRLAGGVAHDFNNLLTAILGYCELLLGHPGLDASLRADLAEIQHAGNRAAGLTRQLLAFSRKQIIEPTLLDLNAIVRNLRSMLQRIIREDVEVVLDLAGDVGTLNADRGQLEQVIMNLAVNASDAMPAGGTLTIGTANVEVDQRLAADLAVPPGPYVALTVTDTGTGMPPQVRERLFEAFFTTKEVGKGTGLGLATVHGIVTRSGGGIAVSSDVGAGTSFTIYLPRVAAGEEVADVTPTVEPPRGGQTVLVVDDADELRQLAKRLLEHLGYTVLCAANADDALRIVQENASIDVLLTDVVMPGVSGPDLADSLVAGRPGLKVIYMSGYTDDAIVHHGVLNPGIAFLHKPFTSETLGRKIREALSG
jgi:two-component system cell cycle sensor histidine kinase/response regulator CckA